MTSPGESGARGPVGVLIAADSRALREALEQVLGADPGVRVVGTARDGREAVELTRRLRPHVVTMDIGMPGIDGLEATKRIMSECPTPIVVVSASASERQVGVAMSALNAGALALVDRPPAAGSAAFAEAARRLVGTVRAMAGMKLVRRRARQGARRAADATVARPQPRAIAIAASTGGPAALGRLLGALRPDLRAPILVVQHIAPGFVQGLATWLDAVCPMPVRVAQPGERLSASTVYLAPDDRHLAVAPDRSVRLHDGPPVDGFRPSASPLFESVGAAYGAGAIGVVLTGMGRDGLAGLHALERAGGTVVAQDERSCLVFGMPRAAIEAGLARTVLPLTDIAAHLHRLVVPNEPLR